MGCPFLPMGNIEARMARDPQRQLPVGIHRVSCSLSKAVPASCWKNTGGPLVVSPLEPSLLWVGPAAPPAGCPWAVGLSRVPVSLKEGPCPLGRELRRQIQKAQRGMVGWGACPRTP